MTLEGKCIPIQVFIVYKLFGRIVDDFSSFININNIHVLAMSVSLMTGIFKFYQNSRQYLYLKSLAGGQMFYYSNDPNQCG